MEKFGHPLCFLYYFIFSFCLSLPYFLFLHENLVACQIPSAGIRRHPNDEYEFCNCIAIMRRSNNMCHADASDWKIDMLSKVFNFLNLSDK